MEADFEILKTLWCLDSVSKEEWDSILVKSVGVGVVKSWEKSGTRYRSLLYRCLCASVQHLCFTFSARSETL